MWFLKYHGPLSKNLLNVLAVTGLWINSHSAKLLKNSGRFRSGCFEYFGCESCSGSSARRGPLCACGSTSSWAGVVLARGGPTVESCLLGSLWRRILVVGLSSAIVEVSLASISLLL